MQRRPVTGPPDSRWVRRLDLAYDDEVTRCRSGCPGAQSTRGSSQVTAKLTANRPDQRRSGGTAADPHKPSTCTRWTTMDSAGQAGKSYQSAGLPVYTADSDSNTGGSGRSAASGYARGAQVPDACERR